MGRKVGQIGGGCTQYDDGEPIVEFGRPEVALFSPEDGPEHNGHGGKTECVAEVQVTRGEVARIRAAHAGRHDGGPVASVDNRDVFLLHGQASRRVCEGVSAA